MYIYTHTLHQEHSLQNTVFCCRRWSFEKNMFIQYSERMKSAFLIRWDQSIKLLDSWTPLYVNIKNRCSGHILPPSCYLSGLQNRHLHNQVVDKMSVQVSTAYRYQDWGCMIQALRAWQHTSEIWHKHQSWNQVTTTTCFCRPHKDQPGHQNLSRLWNLLKPFTLNQA